MENAQNLVKNAYTLVVKAKIDNQQTEESYMFDTVSSISVTSTSEITTHPMINGDIVADHMYNNPVSMSVSGSISLYGNKRYDYKGLSRLHEVETIFEKIKSQGVLCTLVQQNQANLDETRFKVRKSMVLNSISWTESQSSLGFTFGFMEVKLVDTEKTNYVVDATDTSLPAVTDTATLDFTNELLDLTKVDEYVIKIFQENDLISPEFLNYTIQTISTGTVIGLVGAAAIGVASLALIVTYCGLSAAFPVGTIIAAALASCVFIASSINSAIKIYKKANAQKTFKTKAYNFYKNNDKKNEAEFTRFVTYLGTIHQNLQSLNDYILLYGITSNQAQTLGITIDNEYYVFTFTKNMLKSDEEQTIYSLLVTNMSKNDKEMFNKDNIIEFTQNYLSDCTTHNMLFRTSSSSQYVYLINKKLGNEFNIDSTKDKIYSIQNDLTNYCILVSTINLEEFDKLLNDIIKNAMTA